MLLLSLIFIKISTIQVDYTDGSFYLKNNSFEIGWIHSVEKEPWFESYEKEDSSLLLTTTRFKTFGAGVPSSTEVIKSDDGFVHMAVNEQMDEIRLAVSKNVQTTLYTGKNVIALYELVEDYDTVVIHVEKVSLLNLFRGEKID